PAPHPVPSVSASSVVWCQWHFPPTIVRTAPKRRDTVGGGNRVRIVTPSRTQQTSFRRKASSFQQVSSVSFHLTMYWLGEPATRALHLARIETDDAAFSTDSSNTT